MPTGETGESRSLPMSCLSSVAIESTVMDHVVPFGERLASVEQTPRQMSVPSPCGSSVSV